MLNNKSILAAEGTYHIYNRANGNEKMFLSDDNYCYFLRKYDEYIEPFVETFCYCLMPNHFHFLLKIKTEKEIEELILKEKGDKVFRRSINLQGFQNLEGLTSRQFSNFFNAYAKAFNKQHRRKGSLFMHTFKRKQINDEKYLRKLIHYIHYNPVEAGLVKEIKNWRYSSYQALISNLRTKLVRREVLKIFENKSNFIYCHNIPPSISGIF